MYSSSSCYMYLAIIFTSYTSCSLPGPSDRVIASKVDMAHSGPGGPSSAAATPSGGGDGGEDTMRLYSVFQNSFNKIASGGGPGKSLTLFSKHLMWHHDS